MIAVIFELWPASLASCARLRADEEGMQNFKWAQEMRFILKEERTFTQAVAGTVNQMPMRTPA